MINPVLPFIFLLAGSVLAYAMGRAEHVFKKKYLAAVTGLLFFGIALLLQILLATQIWENGVSRFLYRRYALTNGCLSGLPCPHRPHIGDGRLSLFRHLYEKR